MAKTSRAEIVAAARDLIRQKGYAGTSMKEVADKVGLLKGSLYSHFSSKEELVPEVLALTYAQTFGDCVASGDWYRDYTAALNKLVSMLSTHHRCIGVHLAYGLDPATPALTQEVQRFFLDIRTLLETLLRQGLETDLAHNIAIDSISLIEGAALWLVVDGNGRPLNVAQQTLLDRVGAYAQDTPNEAVCQILNQSLDDWRVASAAERNLAERLVEAEKEIRRLRLALDTAAPAC